MECCPAINNEKFVGKLVEAEITVLTEISQTQKQTVLCVILKCEILKINKA